MTLCWHPSWRAASAVTKAMRRLRGASGASCSRVLASDLDPIIGNPPRTSREAAGYRASARSGNPRPEGSAASATAC